MLVNNDRKWPFMRGIGLSKKSGSQKMTGTHFPSKQHQQFDVAELEMLVGGDNVNDTLQLFLDGANKFNRCLAANDQVAPALIIRVAHQMRSVAKLLGMVQLEGTAADIARERINMMSDRALLNQALITSFHEALKFSAQDVKHYLAENKQVK